jgi:hypothetical protein
MKYHKFFIAIFILLTIIIVDIFYNAKNYIDISDMAVPIETVMSNTGWQVIPPRYDEFCQYRIFHLRCDNFFWENNQNKETLIISVKKMLTPLEASLEFPLEVKAYTSTAIDMPNFNVNRSALYPKNWTFSHYLLDDQIVICAYGNEFACGNWWYLGRIGQYTFLVILSAGHKQIYDKNSFEIVIESVVDYWSALLVEDIR